MNSPSQSRRHFLATAAAASLAPFIARGAERPRIKIGQIGTSHAHAGGKMDTMRASADFEVVGVVEPDAGRRAHLENSKTYAGVPVLTEEQLLNTPGLQAVAVETEVKDLLATAARCIAAGKHIHLDKPAGESLPAFKRVLDAATQRKLTVQMGYMFRHNPAFELCFRLLREGALGEVFSIDTQMSKLIDPAGRKALLGYRGGSMFELGCHVIDAVGTVLGRPGKVTAFNRSVAADGFADNQLAVLEYPKATVTVRSALTEVDGGARRQFVVCGTKGTFDIRPLEAPAARLALDTPHGEFKKGYQDVKFPKTGGRYDGDFAELAQVIRGEKAFPFSPEHDLAVQETVLLASGLAVG
ncbi:MAG: Gfo/Idh/MocA family oxidoreductase [Chthoniobacteraceae bacterium]